ncbi:MAG: antibiotic biosynthesis monooxygenase [Clostridia bacterium]|nr:antibiotic biosynthesis monooxygenase [Clostridia bacterium]
MDYPETVLLIDQWRDQAALDDHHASSMMTKISELREKYDLHMTVEMFERMEAAEDGYIRK